MIIAISGFAGSGKTTLGKLLAERLNYRFVSYSFKEMAKEKGMGLMEFHEYAEKHPEIDLELDKRLKSEASEQDSVVATWLAGWILDADFKVFVFAPDKVRASRVSGRDKMGEKEAVAHIKERDNENIRRYRKLYGIDITDTSGFDLCISADTYKPDQLADIVVSALDKKFKRRK
ncbi:MAG: (d)CMP kinase [Candidatus Bilamarchaeaceae archaeon]